MALVAQYAGHSTKGGQFFVRFAVWPEEKPLPKHTVEVDATECSSMEEVEALAFAKMEVTAGHPLQEQVDKAVKEARQVKQPAGMAEYFERGRTGSSKPPAPPSLQDFLKQTEQTHTALVDPSGEPLGDGGSDKAEDLIGR
jgi:hypothetical protein